MSKRALSLLTLLPLFPIALSFGALAACDENPGENQKLGALELTTTAPTIEQAFTTADGWSIKYDRFLVHLSSIKVESFDGVLTASNTAQIIDQVPAPPKSLLAATVRTARAWENVNFQIGPAAAEGDLAKVEPVTDADVERFKKDGLALYVEGKATKAGSPTVAFKWSFTSDTLYSECTGDLNGVPTPGLVVPPDGVDVADIAMRGDVLFRNDGIDAAPLRFDPIAAADADKNNEVTQAELEAVTLEALRLSGAGAYGVGGATDVTTLSKFVEERTKNLVGSFHAKGSCKAAPPPSATGGSSGGYTAPQ